MGGRELMRVQIETLFTHDARGRLVRVNEPNGKSAPRFFLGTTPEGNEWRVRHDVDDAIAFELESLCGAEPVRDVAPVDSTRYEELLARVAPTENIWAGPAFWFERALPDAPPAVPITDDNRDLLRPHLEEWLGDVGYREAMFAVVVDGHAVSIAASVRTSRRADEVGVETAPAFRGNGYARQVVIAWAHAIRGVRRIPLYSTSWQNLASQALARSLGLSLYGADLSIH
jgi:RimJ/RimL family protein N-acetyltransferase